jgi:hypothetical protein
MPNYIFIEDASSPSIVHLKIPIFFWYFYLELAVDLSAMDLTPLLETFCLDLSSVPS